MNMHFNIADLFESIVDARPGNTALVCEQRRLNYTELDERANRLANYWQSLGLGQGDHIGLQLRNGSEYIEGMLAAYKIRAVPININYNYVEAELAYIYDNADLVGLVCHRQFLPRATVVAANLDKLGSILYVDDDSTEEVPHHCAAYEQALLDAAPAREFGERSDDDLYIVYTGGTTGMPKGVMWRHVDIFFSAMGGGDPDNSKGPITAPEEIVDRIPEMEMAALPTPPFMHAAAQWLAMNTLFAAGKLVIPANGEFDAQRILQAVSDEKVLLIVIVGDAMATPLCNELEANPNLYDTSSLFAIASGGALFSPSTKNRVLELLPGRMIIDGLGSSETGAMGNKLSAESGDSDQPRFMVGDSMTVLDDNDQPVQPGSGVIGRLAKKGHVPLGYYKAPEKSAETFVNINGERWAIPGDMASVEDNGTILLHGRGSTSINTGGEKVFPEEVEATLKAHPDIADTLVVGVPDERWGQAVVALYRSHSGEDLTVEQVRDFCRGTIAGYKAPRAMVKVDAIKRTPAAKADYVWAKEEAISRLAN
jgi:acyl-CoA synthetase (AMP-forming)/AMP-acid ligase II